MFFKAVAIAALSAAPVAESAGCYPVWRSGSGYFKGSMVSATVVLNATAGTTQTKNFECLSGSQPSLSHCPTYDPSNPIQASAAWSDEGVCSGSATLVTPAPTNAPTHPEWSGTGCPNAWVSGADYEGGDLAEVDGVVYQCKTAQFVNVWCGQSNYKPGDSLYWSQAWTLLGSCVGTISPTGSPNYVSLNDAGGCPEEWTSSGGYEEGDKVMKDNVVYQCRSWPNSGWCNVDQYVPGGQYSADAWTLLGYCDGTISPTTAPAFSSLADAGGCPLDWTAGAGYEAGDKVSIDANGVEKVVYECSTDVHQSRYCDDYEPGHWSKLGWKLIGYCEGTISPTQSPVFTRLTDHNGCPEAYVDGDDYEANDKVSVEVTSGYSVVYQCSGDVHQSRYCTQYEPGNEFKLGWSLIGYCEGTMSPTASPVFTRLAETGAGCPKEYSTSTTYEGGDRVSVFVSGSPDRAVVYECRSWPNGAYCNAGPNYSPESVNANMGWSLKGYCDGTISPTISPSVYGPAAKCRWYNGTKAVTIGVWDASKLSTYVSGTRVRKHTNIYKCKGWPNGLWCKMGGSYEPEVGSNWADAWSRAGECADADAPTVSPSASPTSSPSKSPTPNPSRSPTKKPTPKPTP